MKLSGRATVVIGAGFGDEGKGLVTDYYASRIDSATVVRFNGGAQAGHTVCTPAGQRHVFSHVASGTFAGARTFLSKHFVVDPALFLREWKRLQEFKVCPEVLVDRRARVSLPYDALTNQIVETNRARNRHGSCGIGFGECIERSLTPELTLEVKDLIGVADRVDRLRRLIEAVKKTWLPVRLAQLGVTNPRSNPELSSLLDLVESEKLRERWIEDAIEFGDLIKVANVSVLADSACRGALIFEGAQGLLLDQNHRWFPHVTRSNTGLRNVVEIVQEVGLESLDVTYVTRSYTTRHGAGPLPRETPVKPYEKACDNTNLTNTYQGSLRYAYLDLDLLRESVNADLHNSQGAKICRSTAVAITCLDQVDHEVVAYICDHKQRFSEGEFLAEAKRYLGVNSIYTSHGPTRETFSQTPPTY